MSELSGRYQSRILSFVSRQTQKFADRTGTLLRHFKVTTIWGAQIVLYPIYALFQSARLMGRQLRQTVQQVWQKLPIAAAIPQLANPDSTSDDLAVDAPLQQVLDAIVRLGVLSQPDRSLPQSAIALNQLDALGSLNPSAGFSVFSAPPSSPLQLPLPRLQGIASLIEHRRLVLVATGNEILDILTPNQQQRLQRQLIWALASYWYAWRQRWIGQVRSPLPLPRDRATLFLPIRLFGQLMAWIQAGPVATAANLFHESALEASPALDWFNPEFTLPEFHPESLTPRLPSTQDWQLLRRQLPTPSEIPILIQAAIRYFFGERHPLLSPGWQQPSRSAPSLRGTGSSILADPSQPSAVRLADPAIADPWLTLPDVFGGSAVVSARQVSSPAQLALPPYLEMRWRHPIKQWMQRYLSPTRTQVRPKLPKVPRSTPPKRAPARLPLPAIDEHAVEIIPAESNLPTLSTSVHPTQTDSLTHPPLDQSVESDWIETQATPVGYVKHPLTWVLTWLDRGLVWLEQRLIALWNGLRRLLR